MSPSVGTGPVAFVLGGGGVMGASEIGMLRALVEARVRPDLVCGTSVGAINGAVFAVDPGPPALGRLERLWRRLGAGDVFAGSQLGRAVTLARSRTHLHSAEPLRRLLTAELGEQRIEDLAVQFSCVAACIETAAEHWFDSGPLVPALLASSAVPGLLPAHRIGERHFLDGGLVDSIPVDRAVALGSRTVYVLHAGRIEAPLHPPRHPGEVALVAFEIARRHRFVTTLAQVPADVAVHVLPSGGEPVAFTDRRQRRYRDASAVPDRVAAAYEATRRYLQGSAS